MDKSICQSGIIHSEFGSKGKKQSQTENEQRLGVRAAAGIQDAHSPDEPALRQLRKPIEKMMRPRTRVTADTETFTVCTRDSPGAAKPKT